MRKRLNLLPEDGAGSLEPKLAVEGFRGTMPEVSEYLKEVVKVVERLEKLQLNPVLVGGMALVILGSRRVTRDFDFVIRKPEEQIGSMVGVFYDSGFELASRVNSEGEIVSTVDNRRIAAIRIQIDGPSSVYFFNPKTGLRIDLLFDFPIPAVELLKEAKKTKIGSQVIFVASEQDLIRLKKIAKSERNLASDIQDLEFLKARQKTLKK